MNKPLIDARGCLMFSSHKGKHHSKVPASWLDWACANVKGFATQLAVAKTVKTTQKTGRRYVLDYTKKYERRIQ